ncbi:RNA polymerase sigma factor [Engelhardtia mirabilis]|uniref:RNA polymerase sigma factor n=1 Tax=Engelhardtia mirabilis TaxID=2528011 RepID=A0A518BT51_9BACT|nr:hypothetical protein Pla133_52750 [Planctomycetes bacterium Pla133]QDV04479.1 hypothetical protein Pla86_52750 [Planctomycetes bacterium Pla86]
MSKYDPGILQLLKVQCGLESDAPSSMFRDSASMDELARLLDPAIRAGLNQAPLRLRDDLTQDAWAKILADLNTATPLEKLKSLARPGRLAAWGRTIAANTARDALRKNREASLDEEGLGGADQLVCQQDGPAVAAEGGYFELPRPLRVLRSAKTRLGLRVLILRLRGRTWKEVAHKTGVPDKTVRRALDGLVALIKERGLLDEPGLG